MTIARKKIPAMPASDRTLTMQETMDYLSDKGFPCRSRSTFYRVIDDFKIPFIDTNPHGKHAIRRFPLSVIQDFLKTQGLEP